MSKNIESMTVTPSPGGLDDRLYISTVGEDGVRHIEFMRPLFRETDDLSASWHIDESPGIATLGLDSCTPGLGDGGFPSHPGTVGTTTLSADIVPPDTGLPAPGTSIPSGGTSTKDYFNGINLAFKDAVLFDGSTYLYGVPSHSNSTSLSMSFWVETANLDPSNFQGVIIGSGSRTVYDYDGDADFVQGTTLGFSSFFASTNQNNDEYYEGFVGDAGETAFLNGANNAETQFPAFIVGQQYTVAPEPNPSGTALQAFAIPFNPDSGSTQWTHVMFSIHQTSSTTSAYSIYFNDVAIASNISVSFRTLNGGSIIPFVPPTSVDLPLTFPFSGLKIGAANWIPRNFFDNRFGSPFATQSVNISDNRPGSCFIGCMAELWVAPGQYIDWSVQANRMKFHTDEIINPLGIYAPVNLGATGAAPTGTKPLVYCSGLGNTHAGPTKMFRFNRARGGQLAVNGDLILCPDGPPDGTLM